MKLIEEKLRTFNEWSNLSYKILKGSKAVSFNVNGEALFSLTQVKFSPRAGYETYKPKSQEYYEGLPEGYYAEEKAKYEHNEAERKRFNEEYNARYNDIFESMW